MTTLEELKPTQKARVMDLVALAGLDVSDWSNYAGPPASNPKYCYEWVYADEDVGIIFNLWYDKCEEYKGVIFQKMNFRSDGRKYTSIGKPVWAARVKRMDEALLFALKRRLPIRVILLDGIRKVAANADSKPSKVERRMLDPEFWAVESYNKETGDVVLRRGGLARVYEDQFTHGILGNEVPEKRAGESTYYERDPKVRNWVLNRAEGCCEFCGQKGFRTVSGSIYLETHHIKPLSEGGPDIVGNVIALCPNHHREAHFAENRDEFRVNLKECLRRSEFQNIGARD